MSNTVAQDLIASKRSAIAEEHAIIAKAQARVRDLRAELRGIEELAKMLPQDVVDTQHVAREPKKRGRGLSAHWKALLYRAGEYPNRAISLKNILRIAPQVGAPSNVNTIRSQVSQLVKRGYLVRVASSIYQLTELGVREAAAAPKSKAPDVSTPGASDQPDDERGGSSSNESGESGFSLAALPGASPADSGQ